MKRKALLVAAIAVALVPYAAVSLAWGWAAAGWQVRGWTVNGAEPLPDGGVRFRDPGIAFAAVSPAWMEAARRSHRLEISLRVRSFVPEQFGPARILTHSLSPYERNLTIGQDGADLAFRLRTPWTDANGTINGQPVARVQDLFLTSEWADLSILIEPGQLRIAVAGELLVEESLPPRPLETWDPSHRLAFGNEITGTRPWLGEIHQAVVRVGDSTETYSQTSDLEIPPRFLITGRPPKLVPLLELDPKDAISNVILYVPLGLLLGFRRGSGSGERRWRVVLAALLFIAAVSASLETLQFFFPHRWPSVDDVIFNTLGGGLGLLLALWVRRRLRAARHV